MQGADPVERRPALARMDEPVFGLGSEPGAEMRLGSRWGEYVTDLAESQRGRFPS